MKSRITLFFICLLLVAGCTGGNSLVGTPSDDEDAVFQLAVDWDYIDSLPTVDQGLLSATSAEDFPEPTHVGVRLVMPNLPQGRQGVYTESATRSSAEEDGLIVLEVPPVDNAYLQVIVVHRPERWDEHTHYLYYAGGIRDLDFSGGTLYSYSISDIELHDPRDQWQLLPPWDALLDSGELELQGGQDYHFQWSWMDGFPLPMTRREDPKMPWLIGNFGRMMEDGGWYDFGGTQDGIALSAPESGEWTVGFQIWIPGDDYGLDVQSYYLPTTARQGDHANSRWTLRFVEE